MKLKIYLLTAVMVASVTAVMAQEKTFTPYGSVRYFLGAYYQDKQMVSGTPGTKADRYDVDLVNTLIPGTSRFGTRFTNGNLTGQFELGLYGGHNGRVGVRQAWGAYKFDFGLQVLIGNTDAPWYKPMGAEAWDIVGGPGTTQGDRAPRIRLSFMGLYIDLQRAPVAGSQDGYTGYWNQYYGGQDQIVPLTTIGYEYKSDMIDFGIGVAGYKYFHRKGTEGAGAVGTDGAPPAGTLTLDEDDNGDPILVTVPASARSGPDSDHSLGAYMAFVNAHIKLGGPYVKLNVAYEKAPHLLGINATGPHFKGGSAHAINPDLSKDSDTFIEGGLELGYKTQSFGIGAAVGYMRNLQSRAKDADRISYGLNIDIPVAAGFRIVPTVYYLDERKNAQEKKQGADMLAGLKFQLDL